MDSFYGNMQLVYDKYNVRNYLCLYVEAETNNIKETDSLLILWIYAWISAE